MNKKINKEEQIKKDTNACFHVTIICFLCFFKYKQGLMHFDFHYFFSSTTKFPFANGNNKLINEYFCKLNHPSFWSRNPKTSFFGLIREIMEKLRFYFWRVSERKIGKQCCYFFSAVYFACTDMSYMYFRRFSMQLQS